MTDFESSHGKPRPTLLRRTDVTPEPERTAAERLDGRHADGRAANGNQIAIGRGWKFAIRRLVAGAVATTGMDPASESEIARIVGDSATMYAAILRDAPVSGALMRMNAAGAAREFALAGYLDAKALETGLLTELGASLAERASFHRQRCERLTVTVHAMSQRAGKRKSSKADAINRSLDKGGSNAK